MPSKNQQIRIIFPNFLRFHSFCNAETSNGIGIGLQFPLHIPFLEKKKQKKALICC